MLRASLIALSITLCLAAFNIIMLVGEILQALFYSATSYFIRQPLIIVKMKFGKEILYFQLSLLLFILILLILFMINDRVLTEYFLFVELGQVIAIAILIILAIIGYIQIKKEK